MVRLLKRVRSSSASRIGDEEYLKAPVGSMSRKRSISLKPLKPKFLRKGDWKKHTTTALSKLSETNPNHIQPHKGIASNRMQETKGGKEKKKICKFKDDALNKDYQLIPTKARKAPFGRCYFARHRQSKKIVLIAMIFQHIFDQFQGDCGEDELHSMMKAADPNLRGLRETIQCAGAVALVMDISIKTVKDDASISKEIKMQVPTPMHAEAPAGPKRLQAEIEEDEIMALQSNSSIEGDGPEPQRSPSSGSWWSSWFYRPSNETVEAEDETKKEIKSAYYRGEAWSVASAQDTNVASVDNDEMHKPAIRKLVDLVSVEESIEKSVEDSIDETSSSINSTDALKGEKYAPRLEQRSSQVRDEPSESRRKVFEEREISHSGDRSAHCRRASRVVEAVAEIEERHQTSRSREFNDYSTIYTPDYSTVKQKKRLTVWTLLSTLELADCMPLAALDDSFDDGDSEDLFSVEEYDDDQDTKSHHQHE